MKTKADKNKADNSETGNNKKPIINPIISMIGRCCLYFFSVVYVVALIFSVLSLFSQIITGNSFANCIVSRFNLQLQDDGILMIITKRCTIWFIPKVVANFVKMIGIISVLITYTYRHLDDKELGISNHELLKIISPHYHFFTVVHVAAVVLCWWASSINQLELAFFTLVLTVIGTFFHWRVLYHLFLSRKKQRELALKEYDLYLRKVNSNKSRDKIVSILSQMCKEINLQSVQDDRFVLYFVSFLYQLAVYEENYTSCIKYLIYVLEPLWRNFSNSDNIPVFSSLLRHIDNFQPNKYQKELKDQEKLDRLKTVIYVAFFIVIKNHNLLSKVSVRIMVCYIKKYMQTYA